MGRSNRTPRLSWNGTRNGKVRIATACFVASLIACLTTTAVGGIRGPGKYSGVVIFDKWGGCILFSGVYLMYVSDSVKDQLRGYEGQAIEIDALARSETAHQSRRWTYSELEDSWSSPVETGMVYSRRHLPRGAARWNQKITWH